MPRLAPHCRQKRSRMTSPSKTITVLGSFLFAFGTANCQLLVAFLSFHFDDAVVAAIGDVERPVGPYGDTMRLAELGVLGGAVQAGCSLSARASDGSDRALFGIINANPVVLCIGDQNASSR